MKVYFEERERKKRKQEQKRKIIIQRKQKLSLCAIVHYIGCIYAIKTVRIVAKFPFDLFF